MEEFLSRVEATLRKYKMLVGREQVLAACSGGPDSVALVHVLRELASRFPIRLSLLHFDHRLRPGSAQDFEFVRRLAKSFHLPFYGGKRKPGESTLAKGLSPEERARQMRYQFFAEVAKKTGIRKIALAHQQDDQAETVLMRLVQGTGLRGLQGIRPVMKIRGMTLIRPFMEVSRLEIRKFLRKRSLPFRVDPTNRSRQFLRNRIRSELLPRLEKKFNPQIRESLCRLAETAYAESRGLDEWARQNWQAYLRSRKNGAIWLDRNRFLSLPGALQFRLLGQMLQALEPRSGLDFEAWERIEQGFRKGRFRVSLPRNLDLHLSSKKLFVKKIPAS